MLEEQIVSMKERIRQMEKNWQPLWLGYDKREDLGNGKYFEKVFLDEAFLETAIVNNAKKELTEGVGSMLGISVNITKWNAEKNATGCAGKENGLYIVKENFSDKENAEQGYAVCEENGVLVLRAMSDAGMLYGVFEILRRVAMEQKLENINKVCVPDMPLRMFNHWDNIDGSIERGYSGYSFFFAGEEVLVDERTVMYARLAASTGINGAVINNVNVRGAANELITDRYFAKLRAMADIFESYGIKLFLSINYAAPIRVGGLETANPLDETVKQWWKERVAIIYKAIPNLGGFLVKADSEGNHGPFAYGCDHAQGANMLAEAIKDYNGIIIWRCFVYNASQDWRDTKTDRAKAAYDNFIGIDGKFADNVILQIKNGPMDFQIREPISPLFGALKNTNMMLEVQAAQEYTGQQIDVCYLLPLYKEVLSFKTYCKENNDTVADVVSGKTYGNKNAGMAAVTNTGNDANWTGNQFAGANFYGFGRLAFDTSLSAEEIAIEWIRQAVSTDDAVVDTILKILMNSREIYEHYTSPLGIGWMVTPSTHYGPSIEGYEYSRWGTYHRADHLGIGVDRTVARGTGYTAQYNEPNASMYENRETCPEELVLFFHRVLYTDVLKSGKTLIQHIYDTHFDGVKEVEEMMAQIKTLEGKVKPEVYANILERMNRQLYNAKEWCDQVNSYFFRKSGIADEKGRTLY